MGTVEAGTVGAGTAGAETAGAATELWSAHVSSHDEIGTCGRQAAAKVCDAVGMLKLVEDPLLLSRFGQDLARQVAPDEQPLTGAAQRSTCQPRTAPKVHGDSATQTAVVVRMVIHECGTQLLRYVVPERVHQALLKGFRIVVEKTLNLVPPVDAKRELGVGLGISRARPST